MNKWVIVVGIVFGVILLFGLVIFIVFSLLSPPNTALIPTPTPSPVMPTSTPVRYPTPLLPQSPLPIPNATLIPLASPTSIPIKIYNGSGFAIRYPANWGLLTCANSANFEFDPNTSADQLGVICNIAAKPISFILDNNLNGCMGQQIQLGSITVIKGITANTPYTQYQWCTQTTPVLKITHRVASNPSRAVGTIDHSAEIERMIATIQFNTNQVSSR